MPHSRLIHARSLARNCSNKNTKPLPPRQRGVRPILELLEDRTLLSVAGGSTGELWLARFDGLPGNTRTTQI